ncbi:MAG: von Willebrand factor type A domain-containing protein, partial [Ferruginibacter sp.]|nr:von Willebrand factor type A domain-containing protein [Ferruginibacter sp.]
LSAVLKTAATTVIKYKPKLISFTKNAKETERFNPAVSDETYFKLVENEFVKTENFPNTGFSLNVNKAAYSNVRRFINMHSKVPPDAVRIEEMINYFNLGYEVPTGKDIFNINSSITACPWNTKNQLLFLKISARKIDLNKIPPGNFVFLIDVSGSMDMPNRLPLLKEAFQLFVKNLRPIDKVSIVTYGGVVGTWLTPTNGDEKEKINTSLELLEAKGDTPGESAILAAYKLANATFIPGGNNRVIIATDGDFNVGQTSEKALDELITKQRQTGIYLTCLGVGMGNFKDSKLQTLAKHGNGNYAYLDNLHEAEKVLVHELTETLYAVAENAFINVVFNPTQVGSYRLIGFDNKREAVQDGSSQIDGGEIGSGGSTMAIFEIVPGVACNKNEDVGKLYLKFKDAEDRLNKMQEIKFSIPTMFNDNPANCDKFAAAVAMFGLKLKDSPYLNNALWADVKQTAIKAADKTNFLQNDFLKLVDRAIDVYEPSKKKRKIKKLAQNK